MRPGPLVPVAWFGFVWLALGLLLVFFLTGCSSTVLPENKCTPTHQRVYARVCEDGIAAECERTKVCHDAATICPGVVESLCPKERK